MAAGMSCENPPLYILIYIFRAGSKMTVLEIHPLQSTNYDKMFLPIYPESYFHKRVSKQPTGGKITRK